MKSFQTKLGLVGTLALLAFLPVSATAHGGENDEAPAAASSASIPETQFQLKIVDTSRNDPLLGGEVPLEKARVKATFTHDNRTIASSEAHPEASAGAYGVHQTLGMNGSYGLTWDVSPERESAFKVDFPLQVAGAPEKEAGFFTGWRIPVVIVGALLLLFGMYALGRMSGKSSRQNTVIKAAVLLSVSLAGLSERAWAHGGENDEAPAATAGAAVDLKVGIGDLTTETQTKMVGKYRCTLTIKVVKPKPFDPNRLRLNDEQVKTLGIQTVPVQGGAFETGLSITGTVHPNPANIVTVSSRVPGRIAFVGVNVGDAVRAGQTLATVESPDIAEAQGVHTAAQSNATAVKAAYRQSQERVRIAERQLGQQKELAQAGAFSQAPLQEALKEQATANSELATVRADVASAQSQQAQADADQATHQKALQRIQELYDAGIRSKAELEANQLEVQQDKARVIQTQVLAEQQQARAKQAQIRVDITTQRVALEQKISSTNVLTRKEIVQAQGTLDTARLETNQAQANMEGARRAILAARARLAALGVAPGGSNILTLPASIDGIVTARTANVGETAVPDKTLFSILNSSVVWVEGDVFDKDLPHARVGLSVRITSDAVPGKTFTGRINYVSPTVSPETRAVRVRIAVPNPQRTLRPDMFVRALVITEARPQTVTVPNSAIQDDGGIKIVYVLEDGIFERREVGVGESAGGRTEIKSGVKAGEQVVAVGGYQLKAIGKR